VDEDLEMVDSQYGFGVYIEKKDRDKLDEGRITRVVVADHT
jgi:hypothetical protein